MIPASDIAIVSFILIVNNRAIMEASCLFCEKNFKKRRSSTKYCSRTCLSSDLARKGISCKKPKTGKNIICQFCKKGFYVPLYRIKRGDVQFCSRKCLAKIHLAKFADYRFKPQSRPKRQYKCVKINGKRVREHRFIMETYLKRKLESWEHVHHINGDGLDNRLENLVILSNSDHQKVEYLERSK